MTVDLFAASFICRGADPARLFSRRGEAAVRCAMSAIQAMMRRMRRLARAGA